MHVCMQGVYAEYAVCIPSMEPPIQTEYLRSGGAMILTFMVAGAM